MRIAEHRSPYRQRGVVLIFSLIVLLILTIGAVALVRSMNSSLFSAGNMAFRRDLVNQGELAVSTVLAEFQTAGALVSSTVTANNQAALNYSATTLGTNSQGVPTVLLDDTAFPLAFTGADLVGANNTGVTIRYVIDRLCNVTGPSTASQCVQSSAAPTGGTANPTAAVAPPSATVYRLSARITGPRNTQVFLQTSFTKPD